MNVVYVIECMVNGRVYIGSTIDPDTRWNDHQEGRYSFRNRGQAKIDWEQHGPSAFKFSILETCELMDDLPAREQWWIKLARRLVPHLVYNKSNSTSPWTRGKSLGTRSPKHRAALSAAHRGKQLSTSHRAAISTSLKGKICPNGTRAKISASLRTFAGTKLAHQRSLKSWETRRINKALKRFNDAHSRSYP